MTKQPKDEASPLEGEIEPPAKRSLIRHPLDTLPGVIKEICRVYRQMRDEQLDHGKGGSLVWVLAQLRAALETQALERLEQRLESWLPQSKARPMVSRTQITHIAQRIEALVGGEGPMQAIISQVTVPSGFFWLWVALKVVVAFINDWRASAAALCEQLALASAIAVGLWVAHSSDKWSLLP